MVRAASIYSILTIRRILARISRAKPGMPVIPSAQMHLSTPLPKIAQKAIARISVGNAWKISRKRIRQESTIPPKYPATAPIRMPRTAETIVAVIPIIRVYRAP